MARAPERENTIFLSVVLPVFNEERTIVSALERLQACRQAADVGIEVIVVDGGSRDGTRELAMPLADRVLASLPGRARQMNVGAAAANGLYLLFLHADTRLPSSMCELVSAWDREKPQWGFFPVRLSGAGWEFRVIERMISWRSRVSGVSTGDQCQFIARALFECLQGFPSLPLMEDVAMSKRLRAVAPPRIEREAVVTSSRRWEKAGVARTVLLMWALRLAYFCGVSPQRLANIYYPPQPKSRQPQAGSGCEQ